MTQSARAFPSPPSLSPGLPPDLAETPENRLRRWRVWGVIVLAAILLHLLAFMTRVDWIKPGTPPRVEVQQVDPQKLDEIRKRWREQDKQLLLNKDKTKEKSDERPDDAKYMSDRNIRVEKEQRAREHVTVPRPGSPTAPSERQTPQEPSRSERSQTRSKALPNIGNLGVPFRLGETPKQKQDDTNRRRQNQPREAQPGGNQYIADKSLPLGGENILNAEESVYYSFYSRLYEAIGPLWSSKLRETSQATRVMPGDYTTAVDVVMDQQGNLVEVRLLQSSGIREFDSAVDAAWKRIGRFPNPPKGLLQQDGYVHTGWNFTVQVGGGGAGVQLLPPERTY